MLYPESFFSLEGWEYRDVFEGCEKVWEVLPRIKSYVQGKIQPNVSEIRREFGSTVAKTCVIWEGRLLFDGFNIKLGDVTKKKLLMFNSYYMNYLYYKYLYIKLVVVGGKKNC